MPNELTSEYIDLKELQDVMPGVVAQLSYISNLNWASVQIKVSPKNDWGVRAVLRGLRGVWIEWYPRYSQMNPELVIGENCRATTTRGKLGQLIFRGRLIVPVGVSKTVFSRPVVAALDDIIIKGTNRLVQLDSQHTTST